MSDTSTPTAAREHARSMGCTVVPNMPTLPAQNAQDLPEGFSAPHVIWDETLDAGGYTAHILERGTRLRLINTQGDANVSFLAYNADHHIERLNIADTVKVQWNGFLNQGKLLLSDMGRVLMSITQDTCNQHDTFCGMSTVASNKKKYGSGENYSQHPNAKDRFLIQLTKLGLGKKDIAPCVNFFKHVKVGDNGGCHFIQDASKPGDYVELRAEMRCLVVMANCPHVLDPREQYTATPVRVLAQPGPVTSKSDEVRNATPEGQRAFENVDFYYHYV